MGSGFGPVRQLILLALYNVAFVLPLIVMIVILFVAPDRAATILSTRGTGSSVAGRRCSRAWR